jgi:hypothetical protein
MSWLDNLWGAKNGQKRLRARAIRAALIRRALRRGSLEAAALVELSIFGFWHLGMLIVALIWLVGACSPLVSGLAPERAALYWTIGASCWLGAALWGAWDWKRWSKAQIPAWTRGWQRPCGRALALCLKPGRALDLRMDFWFLEADFHDEDGAAVSCSPFKRIHDGSPDCHEFPRSARECLEPLIFSCKKVPRAVAQFALATGSLVLALAGCCLALALSPLALAERLVWRLISSAKQTESTNSLGDKLTAGAWSFGSLAFVIPLVAAAFFAAPFAVTSLLLALGGRALAPAESALSAAAALALCSGALIWCRTAPGAFGGGWMKKPVFSLCHALSSMALTRMDEIPLAQLLDEGWELKRGGRGWPAAAWAAARAPKSCRTSAMIGGGAAIVVALLPLLALEFLIGRSIGSVQSVASGDAAASLKAGLSTLANEGAADFAKAERAALRSVVGERSGAGKSRASTRL